MRRQQDEEKSYTVAWTLVARRTSALKTKKPKIFNEK